MSIRPKKSLLNQNLQRPSALNSIPRERNKIWLDKNENQDPEFKKIIASVLAEVDSNSLSVYPEAGDLYRKLAAWVDVSADSLILTPGSDGAIRLVFDAFVESGDVVIHTEPTFAMYSVYSQIFGADVHTVEYERTDMGPLLNVSFIIKHIIKYKPKLFCLPNPDSPTGTVLVENVLKDILKVCEDCGTVFLVDEAYHPFYEPTVVSWTNNSRNLIVTRTFAKAWGVAGLRIGYAVAHPDTIIYLHKIRPMYEVSTLSVEYMKCMLEHVNDMYDSVARIKSGKDFFASEMRSLGFKVLPAEGNFIHIEFGEFGSIIHKTLQEKVYYREGFNQKCLVGYTRFSIGTKSIMIEVVNIIKKIILEE